MRILLTGATGFIGSHLSCRLTQAGHKVVPVSRRPPAGGIDWSEEALSRGVAAAEAIIHLAGENLVGRRWSERQKEVLRSSRIDTAHRLAQLAAQHRPASFVGASAVGFYGPSETQNLDENAPPGGDFLAQLCTDWEAALGTATEAGVRTVAARIGVVLGQGGGALKKMLPPFRLGLGGPLGSGRQWVSWIHIDDLASLFLFLVERTETAGAYNATAPQPVTMKELAQSLGRALHRPALFPVPAPVLRLALGEAASVLLTGQHVVPRRALAAGFEFRFRNVSAALQDLVAS